MSDPASRRGFLRGLSVLPVAAGGVVVSLPVKANHPGDAELLRLGVDLDAAVARYLGLCAQKAEAVASFKGIEPEIPLEIVRARLTRWPPPFQGEAPPNHDGTPCRKRFDGLVLILWPWEAKQLVEQHDGRTRWGRRFRHLRRFADRYHEEHLAAREAVELPTIETERFEAGRAVHALALKIAAVEAASMPALAVKGRAGLAMHRVWRDDGGLRIEHSYHKLLINLATLDGREPLTIEPKAEPACA